MQTSTNNRFVVFLREHGPFVAFILIYPLLILLSVIYVIVKVLRPKANYQDSLRSQVAVITGSAGGLGRAIANELAKRGCHIAIVDIQRSLAEETAASLAQQYSVKTKAYVVDVTNYKQLQDLEQKVSHDLGTPTVLINSAGILLFSSAENPPSEEISRMINVNLTAVCYTTQIFLPKMKELNRGHIVNIGSLSALVPLPNCAVYAATKRAVRLVTSMIRLEMMYLKRNITATTVMPNFMNTNPNVEKILELGGLMKHLKIYEGDKVAQEIVESMLRGEEELILPSSSEYIYKLLELLPQYVREKFGATLSNATYQGFIRSSRVKTILKAEKDKHANYAKEISKN